MLGPVGTCPRCPKPGRVNDRDRHLLGWFEGIRQRDDDVLVVDRRARSFAARGDVTKDQSTDLGRRNVERERVDGGVRVVGDQRSAVDVQPALRPLERRYDVIRRLQAVEAIGRVRSRDRQAPGEYDSDSAKQSGQGAPCRRRVLDREAPAGITAMPAWSLPIHALHHVTAPKRP